MTVNNISPPTDNDNPAIEIAAIWSNDTGQKLRVFIGTTEKVVERITALHLEPDDRPDPRQILTWYTLSRTASTIFAQDKFKANIWANHGNQNRNRSLLLAAACAEVILFHLTPDAENSRLAVDLRMALPILHWLARNEEASNV